MSRVICYDKCVMCPVSSIVFFSHSGEAEGLLSTKLPILVFLMNMLEWFLIIGGRHKIFQPFFLKDVFFSRICSKQN